MRYFVIVFVFTFTFPAHAFLGTELGPLLQLVGGQVRELERLSESIGIAKDQRDAMLRINEGIEKTVSQIESIQSIIERSQGLDPKAIRSLAELNDYLDEVKTIQAGFDDVLGVKTETAGIVVGQTAVQSETAYLMGQEMISTGSELARESVDASPGRADQITAASASAQMLAQGVELQTLSHIAQLQAVSLDLQRTEINSRIQERKAQKSVFAHELSRTSKKRGRL